MWQTEYQRQFTWRGGLPDIPHTTAVFQHDDAVQVSIPRTDSAVQVNPEDFSHQKSEMEEKKVETEEKSASTEQQKQSSAIVKERSIKDETIRKDTESKQRIPPKIFPYGGGNTSIQPESTYMKSFNVTIPPNEQIYPFTQQRQQRAQRYESERKQRIQNQQQNQDALKSYLQASKIIDSLSDKYQTEYQREYLNWQNKYEFLVPTIHTESPSHPLVYDNLDEEKQKVTFDPIISMRVEPAGIAIPRDRGRRHYSSAYSVDELDKQKLDNLEHHHRRPITSFQSEPSPPEVTDENTRVVRFIVEPPTTYNLAQSLLRRTRQRMDQRSNR